ncbi:hypothetical protein [Luteolibacter sp. LG18]|uniref:hypothetical protein n=1 Tax=Luteolibacter sp. LG18 TaxID=2819286 RepID=UPI002B3075F2|nr:hypothetical protein llg_27000 [Luteolibacter sp. LG18]
MRRLLLLTLLLAACDRSEDRATAAREGRGARRLSQRARETLPKPRLSARDASPLLPRETLAKNRFILTPATVRPPSEEPLEDLRKRFRDLARHDPERGLRELVEADAFSPFGSGTALCMSCFISELVTASPTTAIALTDLLEDDEIRHNYANLVYMEIATRDPALAWRYWDERHAADRTDSPGAILSVTAAFGNLRETWHTYQAHDPSADAALFLTQTCAALHSSSPDELDFAFTLLRGLPDEAPLGFVCLGAGYAIARHDPEGFAAWLDSKPQATRYNEGYYVTAATYLENGDPVTAARWAARLPEDYLKETLLSSFRYKGAADIPEVRALLPSLVPP